MLGEIKLHEDSCPSIEMVEDMWAPPTHSGQDWWFGTQRET